MNFLAHLYLSGNDDQILMGNFIADGVKGKKVLEKYPPKVKTGIELHRNIDFFMDNHALVKQGMSRLRTNYPKFSGVIMDIFYDHILAKKWSNYHDLPLAQYVQNVYGIVDQNKDLLVGKTEHMYPYMKRENWILSYASLEGIESILKQMTRRVKGIVPLHESVDEFEQHQKEYEQEFDVFFQEIQDFVNEKYNIDL